MMTNQPALITLTDPQNPAAEAYRTLRTNLTFAAVDNPIETLVVTSCAPDEEKSTVVANLAVSLAQGERRTILVDADLRRPGLHKLFGVSNERGLTSMIVDDSLLGSPPLVDIGPENLWLVPSGPMPPSPADLLGSQRMKRAIDALQARADIVIFDAPPVISVTDAAVLGTNVDGLLLIITAGRTRREHTQRAKTLLEKARVRIVGVVLNRAPSGSLIGSY
jgi:non-specific protein-tyrosine kinase